MKNKEQVYSMCGEHHYQHEELMNNLREFHNKGEEVEVWEADKKEWKHSDFICAETLVDDMQVFAMDMCGEVAEEYLDELTLEQKSGLRNHIVEWFNANAKLNFYGVENPRKIIVVVE